MPVTALPRILACSVLLASAITAGYLAYALKSASPSRQVAAIYRAPPPPAPVGPMNRATQSPVAVARPEPTVYTVKSILPIEGPLRYGEWHWDDAAGPTSGPIVVTVDLAARVLSVFRDGHEIGTTAVIYGADEKPTPLGVFPVTQKDADHRSSIYGGAPMPYMLRMTNDGVSIHGSDVTARLMTHGCIGVPVSFARRLFGVVKLGDKVIVIRGETLDIGQAIKAA